MIKSIQVEIFFKKKVSNDLGPNERRAHLINKCINNTRKICS